MAVDVKLAGRTPEIGMPHKLFDAPSSEFAVFSGGQRFLFIEPATQSPSPKINVVLNWPAALK